MAQKLIFLDIDGTLTAPGFSVPPDSALEAVRLAKAAGHKVFLCTGRNWSMLQPLLAYGFDGAVGSAGGYVVCDGEVVYDHPMSDEKRDWVTGVLREREIPYCLEAKSGAYNAPEAMRLMAMAIPDAADSELARWKAGSDNTNSEMGHLFRPLSEYDGSPVYKMMYVSLNREKVEEAERILEQAFFVCRQDFLTASGIFHGELINRDFDKGTGMKAICDHLGLSMSDTIGFGDSMNDLGMLNAAGFSVCMENGSEQIKQMCDYVCPPVDQDGLYQGFVHLGLIHP